MELLKEIEKSIAIAGLHTNSSIQIVFSKIGFEKFKFEYSKRYGFEWKETRINTEAYYFGCKVLRIISEQEIDFDYLITTNG